MLRSGRIALRIVEPLNPSAIIASTTFWTSCRSTSLSRLRPSRRGCGSAATARNRARSPAYRLPLRPEARPRQGVAHAERGGCRLPPEREDRRRDTVEGFMTDDSLVVDWGRLSCRWDSARSPLWIFRGLDAPGRPPSASGRRAFPASFPTVVVTALELRDLQFIAEPASQSRKPL